MTMSFRCPQCGREYDISRISKGSSLFRCENPECKHLFFVNAPSASNQAEPDDQRQPPAEARNASPQEDKKPVPEPETEGREIAKDLAQLYFSGIMDGEEGKGRNSANKQAAEPAPSGETWFAEEEEISEETRFQQQQQLLQFAQQHKAGSEKKEEQHQPVHVTKQVKRFLREKHSQRVVYWILLLFICLVPLGRIMYGRMTASITQFSQMQPQIVPSFLYFMGAVDLLYHLLRRTTAPRWFSAFLLLIPLILDWWYLFPEQLSFLSSGIWLTVSNSAKIVIALFALLRSIKAKKHPAKKYKEANVSHG